MSAMTFDEYQALAKRTLPEGPRSEGLSVSALGLAGESGECVDIIKKHLHHGHDLDRAKLVKELGDVLWYVAAMATTIGVSLDEVGQQNILKLRARYPEGFSYEASKNRKEA